MVKQESPKLTALKQSLQKWEALNRLQHNQDYQEYLKPILESAFNNTWPDPAQDEFDKKYVIEFSRAKAYKEVYDILNMAEATIKNLTKQIAEPDKNYEI